MAYLLKEPQNMQQHLLNNFVLNWSYLRTKWKPSNRLRGRMYFSDLLRPDHFFRHFSDWGRRGDWDSRTCPWTPWSAHPWGVGAASCDGRAGLLSCRWVGRGLGKTPGGRWRGCRTWGSGRRFCRSHSYWGWLRLKKNNEKAVLKTFS